MPEDPPLDDEPDDNAVIKELRSKAGRTDAVESENAQLKRELVVHKAGLSGLTDKQQKALAAAHEGDWEPDALKATATELGFGTAPPGEPEPHIPVSEQEAHQRVAAASGGPPAATPDLDAAIAAANNPEELKEVLRQHGRLAVSE